ncbi:MAG: GspMb/PilO family protein [Chthoniobacteraceae bacterium]
MSSPFANLSARERVLAIIVGSVFLLILNVVGIKIFLRQVTAYRQQLSTQASAWQAQQILLEKKDFWQKRAAWLQTTQPKLNSPERAGSELLDAIQALAAKNHLTVQNPAINPALKASYYQSVSVNLEATGLWADTIAFLQQLQKPSDFVVVESAGVRIGSQR